MGKPPAMARTSPMPSSNPVATALLVVIHAARLARVPELWRRLVPTFGKLSRRRCLERRLR